MGNFMKTKFRVTLADDNTGATKTVFVLSRGECAHLPWTDEEELYTHFGDEWALESFEVMELIFDRDGEKTYADYCLDCRDNGVGTAH